MTIPSTECKIFIKRLKSCDVEEIKRDPTHMLSFYPIRDPDSETTIFDEVYSLLNEGLLSKTYRFRMFYFLNIFLSSTKVPAYIIATYIKKLSRLSLNAKPKTLVTILKLIANLFIRHPILLSLRDRVDDRARELEVESNQCTLRTWLENDPFQPDHLGDLKSKNAIDSCVWELMPLRFHRHPRVAEAATFLGQTSMPDMEFEVDEFVD